MKTPIKPLPDGVPVLPEGHFFRVFMKPDSIMGLTYYAQIRRDRKIGTALVEETEIWHSRIEDAKKHEPYPDDLSDATKAQKYFYYRAYIRDDGSVVDTGDELVLRMCESLVHLMKKHANSLTFYERLESEFEPYEGDHR